MKNIQIINDIFDKYKIKEPLPLEVRTRMKRSKKKLLINILSKGKKNIFVAVTVSILLFLKKFGLNLTLLKSAIIAGISAIVVTGTVAVTSAAVYKNLISKPEIKTVAVVLSDQSPASVKSEPGSEKSSSDKIIEPVKILVPFEVGIMNFYSDAKSSAVSTKIMSGINQSLIKSKNPDFAGFVSDGKNSNKSKKILTGSVLKLDNLYKITLKLVDSENTQILLYISETIEKEEDAAKTAESIAKKILEKL